MSEKSKNAPARKLSKPVLSLLTVAFVFFLLWLCFGMTINFRIPAWEYERARARWEASNISDYEMTILFYSMAYIGQYELSIENQQIVRAISVIPLSETREVMDLSEEANLQLGFLSPPLPDNLHDYEISRLLEFTEDVILPAISPEPIIFCERMNQYDIRFNQEYGFVEEISLESCPSRGLLCPTISDCQAGFRLIEFVP